ncbi:MAG: hypothetical protein KGJ23_12235 [Euryarchaeota archaeon]|nr:hypothetical protein [Euryarchaeota archaeon]MDE1837365.1 hypothetical protein [Euryarchaeota archaeon]MDE1881365.1 hypothetical protein [Euryarchaeota archaeon]MDE2045643.1 hypothetical protein [Thermoplasmata archaeon]
MKGGPGETSEAPRRSPHAPAAAPKCSVPECSAESVRSIALAEAKKAFEKLPDGERRAHLCREHYRAWKKATKKDRDLQRLGW